MIATLEAPTDLPNLEGQFLDLTQWLTLGVEYGHLELKAIYFAVGDLGLNAQEGDPTFRLGGRFYAAIREWWDAGYIEMTEARDPEGDMCDFWTAVFMAHHQSSKRFKLVEGYLKIIAVPEWIEQW